MDAAVVNRLETWQTETVVGTWRDEVMRSVFEDLYDAVSRLWSWSWPCAEGKVTEVLGERIRYRSNEKRARLAVAYEFTVGGDGPYTGECFWTPAFSSIQRVADARRKVHAHMRVHVRYRSDDPSVNTIDGGIARLLRENPGRH